METTKIDIQKFSNLVDELHGKIFSVNFVKKDGTIRKMTCRRGVSKYVKGVGLAYDPKSKGLLAVFDMVKKEYRMVNLNTIVDCKIKGNIYSVEKA